MRKLNRRAVLGLGVGISAAGLIGGVGLSSGALAQDEYDELRLRWRDLLTGGEIDTSDPAYQEQLQDLSAEATEYWDTMLTGDDRTDLWEDLPLDNTNEGFFVYSYSRLLSMAMAWATPGTDQHGDADLVADIVSGLDFLYANAYNEDKEMVDGDNWWDYEIGAPSRLTNLCALVYDELSADQIANYAKPLDKFCPNPDHHAYDPDNREKGANRADKAVIVAVRGIVGKSDEKLQVARDGMSDTTGDGEHNLFQYVTSKDGFYEDGSFVQHTTVAYTGTYGNVLLRGVANMLALLANSTWEITDPGVSVIFDAVEGAFEPVTHDGLMMDCVRGRAISRHASGDYVSGLSTTTNVLLLATGAPAAYQERYHALVKGWIQRNQVHPYLESVNIPAIARAKAVLDDDSIPAARGSVGSYVFAGMDRVIHRRPNWSFAISLSSSRISRYEAMNDENLHGWYVGDGMTNLYNDDLEQYNDDFWPTVDSYRLPGTTVDTRTRDDLTGPSHNLPDMSWAGGAVLDNRYTAAGQFLKGQDVTLRAKKSWFCLDDMVVALGGGISSSDGRPIETIVENRNLHESGTNALTVDGEQQPGEQGWSDTFADAGWAHLGGVGGYIFPEAAALNVVREERTGAWADINQSTGQDDPTEITRRYVTLWLDHGSNPSDATYSYVLLPGATPAQTERRAANLGVEILVNDLYLQAIEVAEPSLLMANFWVDGEVNGLSADNPAAVVVQRVDGEIRVAVSEPMRTTVETLTITLPYAASELISADDTVTVETGATPVLTIDVGGSLGRTHQAVLRAQ